MANPYKSQADSSNKSKRASMAVKKKDGGLVTGKYPLKKGGIGSGEGRLELSKKSKP